MVVLFLTDGLEQKAETLHPHDDHTSDKNRGFVSLPTEDDGKVEHLFGSSNLNVKMHALQWVWLLNQMWFWVGSKQKSVILDLTTF